MKLKVYIQRVGRRFKLNKLKRKRKRLIKEKDVLIDLSKVLDPFDKHDMLYEGIIQNEYFQISDELKEVEFEINLLGYLHKTI